MNWIESVVPTVIALGGGAIGWFLKTKLEARRREEELLREERARLYIEVLMPFIRLFGNKAENASEQVVEEMQSVEYRRICYRLMLLGDDDVVSAWNRLWGYIYEIERDGAKGNVKVLLRFGDVLHAIRRGIGSRGTSLTSEDMLRWLIKDIDSVDFS